MPVKSPQRAPTNVALSWVTTRPFYYIYLIGRYRSALYPNITLNGGTNPRRENMLLNADMHLVHP